VSGAGEVLIRRVNRALGGVTSSARLSGADEIGRLSEVLATLKAWRAGADAEESWLANSSTESLRRKTQLLNVLHDISRQLGAGKLSELTMTGVLASVEQALAANSVGIRLSGAARGALGFPATLATKQTPAILLDRSGDPDAVGVAARFLPGIDAFGNRCLIAPVLCGSLAIGLIAAEVAGSVSLDDEQLRFVETSCELIGLAIASVSRSQEERRVALLEERTAIAGELHDSLAQSLAFMKIQISRLQGGLDRGASPADVAQTAAELRHGAALAYRQVRELIATFRVRIGPGGLASALQQTADDLVRRSNLLISLDCRLPDGRLNVNEEFHVLQVVREALSNTVQHARAGNATVSLSDAGEQGVMVIIEDDGQGLVKDYSEPDHYGLSVMQGRANSLGGQLTVGPRDGGGTRVLLRFVPDVMQARLQDGR
jgi:two-component system nitrate/nitrite sensor histidine kinase NarX